MLKIVFILLIPLFLFSKIQIVTYFPLETHLVKKIAQKEIFSREITGRYLTEYRKLPSSEISRLSNSKIYFHFGLDVEKKYEEILKKENPNLIIVDLSNNIDKIEGNPYFWTDPFALRIVAKNTYEALINLDEKNKNFYKENYENFLDEIDSTFLRIKEKMKNSDITVVYTFDNYWDYFAKRFRIELIKEEKKYLDITKVSSLVEYTNKKNIKKILFYRDMDYNIALSYKNNLNLQIIEQNIFEETWQTNLLEFSQNLFLN